MCAEGTEEFYFAKLANGWTVGRFAALDELAGLAHMVTTRQGPDTEAARDDPAAAGEAIRGELGVSSIAFCKQAHGNTILSPRSGGPAGKGDGLITTASSMALMGLSADCPLILATDPVSGAVGLAHASWRGTVLKIASELIVRMVGRYGARPADIVACICPSVGPCCYEVGPDVFQLASASLGLRAEQFFEKRCGKTYFDLWAANVDELLEAGMPRENIHAAGICTVCRNDLFPSHRIEGERAGRFVGVIARL